MSPFAERRFRLLFAARTISMAGSAMAPIALAFAVLEITRSPAVLGTVIGARMIPTVAFSLVGGVWADRLPRQALMVGADLLSAAAQTATAVLVLLHSAHLWQIVVLQIVGGTAAAVFQPALGGIVPQVVPSETRRQANAWLSTSSSAARLGGVALGGVVVGFLGAGVGLAVDAASFLVSALLLARLGLAGVARAERRSMLAELTEGWNEFRSRTWVWAICAQFAVFNAVGMAAYLVLGPLVAHSTYDGAVSWGLIQTGLTAGLVAGGLVALRLRVRRPLLSAPVTGLALVPVLVLLALGIAPVLVLLAAAAAGLTNTVFDALYSTELQNAIPPERLSRVIAYDFLVSFAFIPLGAPAVGALAAAVGPSGTLWIAAAFVAAASLVLLAIPEIRGRTALAPGEVATTWRRRSASRSRAPKRSGAASPGS